MIGKRFAAVCSVAIMASAFPALAANDCAPFPRIALWGEYTHESVRKHVDQNLGGDWNAYVGEMQRQLDALRQIHGRGSAVTVTRDGRTVKLAGEQLAQYIMHADRRLGIVRCLAAAAEAHTVADFSTAAGTASGADFRPNRSGNEVLQRTYITVPEDMLDQLRKMAVRRSVKENRQTSVSEIVVEMLERELRRNRR
jgi:hypothetical protein